MQTAEPLATEIFELLRDTARCRDVMVIDYLEDTLALCQSIVAKGDEMEGMWDDDNPLLFPSLYFHFSLVPRFKQFLLLRRDILFQHFKATVLHSDQMLTEEKVETHLIDSETMLKQAAKEISEQSSSHYNSLKATGLANNQIKKWRHQDSPWSIYKQQITTIGEQCRALASNVEIAKTYNGSFHEIRKLIEDAQSQITHEVSELKAKAKEVNEFLNKDDLQPAQISAYVKQEEEKLVFDEHKELFRDRLQDLIKSLPAKWSVEVGLHAGTIIRPDLDLQKKVLQWLESEIIPPLYEEWSILTNAENDFRISLSNLHNQALVLEQSKEPPAISFARLLAPANDKIIAAKESINELSNIIVNRLSDNFRLAHLFDNDKAFLSLMTVQNTLRQFGEKGNLFIDLVTGWRERSNAWYNRFWQKVKHEEGLNTAEKISRFIEHRQSKYGDSHYSSLFQTKGYIGSSFGSGRTKEMDELQGLIRRWGKGYRGSVLLSGPRLCGKTFFGSWAAGRLFSGHSILHINAGMEVNYLGRKLPGTYDLSEALEFVSKYALQKRPVLWLDDLELWQNAHYTLSENVDVLMHFAARHSTQCFIMASTSEWVQEMLEKIEGIETAFQSVIRLNRMPRNDISNAILIRHGATHKKLVSGDGEILTAPEFQDLVKHICKASHYNIGESLQLWAAGIQDIKEETIYLEFRDLYGLPKVLDPTDSIIIRTILLQKKTDEYRLRKLFGQAFTENYARNVRRLLSQKLLVRNPDGTLEVRDNIANALAGRIFKDQMLV